MRDRFPLVVVAGLVLLVVAGGYLIRSAARGRFADVLSTWRSEPDGARALYLLGEESGLGVGRHQTDLEVIPDGAQLVLLGVYHDGTSALRTDLYRDEADAGVSEDALESNKRGMNAFSAPHLSDDEREKLLEHVGEGNTLLYVPTGDPVDPLLEDLGVGLVPVEGSVGMRTFVPPQPSVWTRGVEHAEAEVRTHLSLPEHGVPLLMDAQLGGTVAALVPWKSGQVVVLSAPELAMNRRLALADNAQLWLSLLSTAARGGSIFFDEFHHGFTDDRSMATFATRYGLHFAVLQLVLGVGLWTFALRRFGRPRMPPEDERVGSTDALFAASRIYREGRHHGYAATLLAKGLAQALAQHAGLSARANAPDVAEALRARGEPLLAEALEQLTERARAADSEGAVEDVARRCAEVRRTLVSKNHDSRSTT